MALIDLNGLGYFKGKENAMIAGTYSASNTYAVGDYVYYSGTLYRCTTAITTAEAWTAAHWTAAKLAEDVTAQSDRIDDVYPGVTKDVWAQGGLAASSGGNSSSSSTNAKRIKTSSLTVADCIKVRASNGYTFSVYKYSSSGMTYQGCLQSDGTFAKTSDNIVWVTEFDFTDYPDNTFKLCVKNATDTSITPTVGSNILFYTFTTDSTLAIAKVPADAKATGDAIQSSNDNTNEIKTVAEYVAFDDIPWRIGRSIDSNGSGFANDSWAATDYLPATPGEKVKYTGDLTDSNDKNLMCWLHEYDADGVWQKRTQMTFANGSTPVDVTLDSTTTIVRFTFGYHDSLSTDMTLTVCQNNFEASVYQPKGIYKPTLKILFIGNSLAYDSVSYVPSVLKSLGVDANITIGILYLGGQSLDMHYEHFVDNDAVYKLTESVNMTPWRNILTDATGLDIITFRKWDMISFQQASTKAGNYSTFQPYLTDLIEFICNNVDYKWKMAWNNVHSTSAGCDPDEPNYNADKMPSDATEASHEITESHYEMVIEALQDMLEENPVEIVFPVATATQNARNTSLGSLGDNGELLYDWKHAQEGIACQVEGYTVAIKLMEILGIHNKSVINDNTVIDSDFETFWNIQGPHGSPVGSTNDATGVANRRIAQKCAIMACTRPMEKSNITVPTAVD